VDKPRGPSFLCIGMAKSGTGFLYDQAEQHPDFWMPPVKELHYLDAKFPGLKGARERAGRQGGARWRHRGDERDQAFVAAVEAVAGQRRNMGLYARLFEPAGQLLTGDVTPAYGFLKPAVIEEFAAYFPDCRLILLVRDPVDRAWSHLCMLYRSGKAGDFDPTEARDPDDFRQYLKQSDAANTKATDALARWTAHAPHLRLQWFRFDDIAADPDGARRSILSYLGADPDKGELVPNRKADREKYPLPDATRGVLTEYLAAEIAAYQQAFATPS
jgi:hypothetical protein